MSINVNKKMLLSTALSSILALSGCGGDAAKSPDLTPVAATPAEQAQTKSYSVFDVSGGDIPYPNDILFAGSTDGTLNIPIPEGTSESDPKYALNALDGFSTSAPISVHFSKSLKASTVASAVKVFEVTTDAATKAVTGVSSTLTFGVDYLATASGNQLVILPLKPLKSSSSYLVVVTDDLQDEDSQAVEAGVVYQYLKSSNPLISEGHSTVEGLSDSSATKLEPLRQLTQAQLAVAQAASIDPTKVVVSWSFSTQSIGVVLDTVASPSTVQNSSLAVQSSGSNTSDIGGQGAADIYAGTITVPYYLGIPSENNPTAPIKSHWLGQNGGDLTRYSIAQGDSPKKVADQTLPVLMTVPNSNSGQSMPASGWPVVIFQHGITRNRSDVLAVADSLAAAGYAAIAIDMPLHGITPTDLAASFRISGVTERTFDLDFVTQDQDGSITAAQPDGVKDSSGRHFIQLSSLLTTRDNLRQAVSDLVQLRAALDNITGVQVDTSKVSFLGHSLGGMVGGTFVKREGSNLKSAVFAMSGTQAAYILANSATFSPEIKAGLQAQGVEPDSADFQSFILAAQTVVDSGDPVNSVADITIPSLMLEVVGDGNSGTSDQVIPNSVATAPLAGTEPWIKLQNMSAITASGDVSGGKGVIRYTAGTHGSILDPTASLATTSSMQTATASFIASQGAQVNLGSDSSSVKTQ
jgi:pimeloyl-ACP methyl ester carboxylesterase